MMSYGCLLLVFGFQILSRSTVTASVIPMQYEDNDWTKNERSSLEMGTARGRRNTVLDDSEISKKLHNIENDLKSLKTYGPLFLYFLSDSKKWYKLVLMGLMYLLLFTFYRKVRRVNKRGNAGIDSAVEEHSQNNKENYKSCSADISKPYTGQT